MSHTYMCPCTHITRVCLCIKVLRGKRTNRATHMSMYLRNYIDTSWESLWDIMRFVSWDWLTCLCGLQAKTQEGQRYGLKAGEPGTQGAGDRFLAQLSGRAKSYFPHRFVQSGPSTDQTVSTHTWEGTASSLSPQTLTASRNVPADTPGTACDQTSGYFSAPSR